jgi:predicted MFS family arabinose efflux permease
VTAVFLLNGLVFSGWYARLPALQERLDLSPGALGLALLGAPLGLLVAQPAVGAVVARRGSRPVVAAAPLLLAAVVLPALAVDAPTLFLAVLVVGVLNGALDVAMNAQGLAVERARGWPILSSLHAAFSFGAFAGAALAGAVAGSGIAPLPHLAAMAAVGAAAGAALRSFLLPDERAGADGAPRLAWPSGQLALLGAVAFLALLAEGAAFDWSGIYLARVAGAPEGVAALGLAAFSLTMGVGRLLGDRVAVRLRAPAATASALAGAGLGLALVVATPAGALAGFALMGLGLSIVFPVVLRASEASTGAVGPALAAVSSFGYVGFLLGPPAIGLLAQVTDLRAALALPCAGCLLAGALARRARL